jgi:DNA-binding response OmpR family regulator
LPEILIIDDNPVQLSVREAVLRQAGFSIMTASSAEEALQLLTSRSALCNLRVIVTDHILPGANGDAFVRQLRAWENRVPVLVVSGMPEAEPHYAGLEIKFLHKPCAPEELIDQVRACFQNDIGSKRAA